MTNLHDNLTLSQTMNYCKADLQSGKPLVVLDVLNGKKKNQKSWKMDLFDGKGNPVRLQCIFGKPNKHGARAILEILR